MNLPLSAPLPASSGYPNYGNLIYPWFARDFITRFYPNTIAGLITQRDIVPTEITDTGNRVVFRRTPVAKVREYRKNEDLRADRLNTVTSEMFINRAKYFNVKLDEVDLTQIQDVQRWIDAYQYDAQERIGMDIDVELFLRMLSEAHPANKGTCAGARTGNYNLGTGGAPVTLTAANILVKLNEANVVLSEANVPQEDRFIVLPTETQSLFTSNQILAQAYASGYDRSLQLMGGQALGSPIAGFADVYFSNLIPRMWDETAQQFCVPILFGRKDATGFVAQLSKNQIIDQDPRAFATYWRGLFIYGMKVLRPEAVGAMYAYVDLTSI